MRQIAISLFLTTITAFSLTIGETPKAITLEGESGGRIDGTAWNSSMLKDKVFVLFYVDPDEKDTNNAFSEALKAKKYDLNNYGTVAIINLEATWLPNFAIESSLKKKQEKYPNTTYVKDVHKLLIKEWELQDDSSDILIFDKSGKLIYSFAGELDETEIAKALKLIDENL